MKSKGETDALKRELTTLRVRVAAYLVGDLENTKAFIVLYQSGGVVLNVLVAVPNFLSSNPVFLPSLVGAVLDLQPPGSQQPPALEDRMTSPHMQRIWRGIPRIYRQSLRAEWLALPR